MHHGVDLGLVGAAERRRDLKVDRNHLVLPLFPRKGALQGGPFKGICAVDRPHDVVVGGRFVALGHQVGLPWRATARLSHGLGNHLRVHLDSHALGIRAPSLGFDTQCDHPSDLLKPVVCEGVLVLHAIQPRGFDAVPVGPLKCVGAKALFVECHNKWGTSTLDVGREIRNGTRIHDQIALHRTRTAKSSGGFQCQRVGHGLVRVVLVHVDGVGHCGREGVVAKIPKVVGRSGHHRCHHGIGGTDFVALKNHVE